MSMLKMGWDKLRRFLASPHTWTGVQTLNSPVLITPALGTPSSGDLVNCVSTSLTATGNITSSTGNFIVGASGSGVDFSATASTASTTKATGTITASGAISDNDRVTIDTKAYTFKTALTPTEGEVLINGSAAAALDNLKSAINLAGVPGTDYSCAAAHPTVEATTNSDTVQTLQARTGGVAGNTIALVKNVGANLAVSGATLTGGATVAATSELFDDYEEGTWTPNLAFGGSTLGITYNAAAHHGYYTKIGNVVTISGIFILTSKGAQTGDATVEGLPFAPDAGAGSYAAAALRPNIITFANQMFGNVGRGGLTLIDLNELTEAGSISSISNSDFADNSSLMFNTTYRVA